MYRIVLGLVSLTCALLSGCGSAGSVSAVATRVLDVDDAILRQMPVCFLQPSSSLSLTERANTSRMLSICESAATRQDTRIVPISGGRCLVATLEFGSVDTGIREGECSRNFTNGANCISSPVFHKTLKVALRKTVGGPIVAETSAAIRSSIGGFTENSYFALCAAAFYKFPQPLTTEKFDSPIE
jgi:hypothetical protein